MANFCGLSAEGSGDVPASFALRSGSVAQLVGSMDCHAFAHRTLSCQNLCPSWVKPGGASTHPPFHATTPPPTCRTITSAVSAPAKAPPAADYDSQPMPPEPPCLHACDHSKDTKEAEWFNRKAGHAKRAENGIQIRKAFARAQTD